MHQPSIRDLLAQTAGVTQSCRQVVQRSLEQQQQMQALYAEIELRIRLFQNELDQLKQA